MWLMTLIYFTLVTKMLVPGQEVRRTLWRSGRPSVGLEDPMGVQQTLGSLGVFDSSML